MKYVMAFVLVAAVLAIPVLASDNPGCGLGKSWFAVVHKLDASQLDKPWFAENGDPGRTSTPRFDRHAACVQAKKG